jgi:hypothetical protein
MNARDAESTPSRGELLDVAFDVARRYIEFGEYGSKERARKALKRRCPGFSEGQYANALDKAVRLLEVSIEVVRERSEALWQRYRAQALRFDDITGEVKVRCGGFRRSTYESAAGWVFFWHHLK